MNQKIRPLLFETYLAVVKNSVGANVWRNFYADVGGRRQDIMRNGDLSCAFFVSSVLALFGFIRKPHGTVAGTIGDMERSGWRKLRKPKAGSVLVWVELRGARGETHKHIGFYVGGGKAVSNSSMRRCPVMHHWTFGVKNGKPKRKIEAIFWNKKLR